MHPALSQVLAPNARGDSHSHPLEIDLPPWILAGGMALRRWLFSHGSALRIETPEALRQEQQGQALEVLAFGSAAPRQLKLCWLHSSSSVLPRGMSLICLRPSLISISSPGFRPS